MWAKTLVFVGIKRIKKDLIAIVSSHCLLDDAANETRTHMLITLPSEDSASTNFAIAATKI